MQDFQFLLSDISIIKGIGNKTSKLLKRKNIFRVFDLLCCPPRKYVDRSKVVKINELKIGSVQTTIIDVKKYNFPRVRNLPNRVICSDDTGEIECVFFNSYEGYVKKILPVGKEITISGKIGYFRNKYQLTNPKYISEDA